MHNKHLLSVLAFTFVLPLAAPVRAQSLADVAAAEAARRKMQTAPAKVYTNDNLSGTMQEAASLSAPAPAPALATPQPSTGTVKPEAVDEKKTEAYWKGRSTTIQQSLARTKVLIEAMQSRINALNAEALSADDPARQAALQTDLTTAVSEMARLKQESEKLNKDLAAMHDEARRANIPPGWLR